MGWDPCAEDGPGLHSGRPVVRADRVKSSSSGKTGYYVLEGVNSFATAYYFNYLMFLLQREHGFTNLHTLVVGAVHGFLYVGASWFAGRFGQRHGYFTSLRIGFAGMAASIAVAWLFPSTLFQVVGVIGWTVAVCFTWPMLEALVSEGEAPDRLPRRIGIYNVTWASAYLFGFFLGGSIYERLGQTSLYWLPIVLHVGQFVASYPLQRRHDARRDDAAPSTASPASNGTPTSDAPAPSPARPRYFQKLAWIGNPFAYMAMNTLLAVVPGIALNLHLSVEQAGQLLSVWIGVRALAFVVLWHWHGWHYRFGWFATAFLLLVGGFFGLMTASQVWVLVVAQVAFGWATGLLYYSSLFYSMDGSDAQGEHGGIHEAFIGIGVGFGPSLSALTLWLSGKPDAPAVAVGISLLLGLAGAFGVWSQGRKPIGN